MNRRMKIGFVHRFDARNLRSWSGTFYFMAKALEAHAGEVVYLGPDRSRLTQAITDNSDRIDRILFKFTGKHWLTDHNRLLSQRLASVFDRRIKANDCDILFAPAASIEIAHLKTTIPIVYFSDITWADIVDYYPQYYSLSSFARNQGDRIEAAAIRRAAAAVYPSEWAMQGACSRYGAHPETTYKVSFGANLSNPPSRQHALNHSLSGPVRLLTVGVDWERKGCAVAFECLTSLVKQGVDAELTICGCTPPPGFEHPRLTVIPFLDKNDPLQQQRISQLFLDSNFLLFPTRADATPIATCEASAHGLPTLVTDTGGTRGSVRDGVNGFVMPLSARGIDYANKILDVMASPSRYAELVTGSRDEYEQSLNWDAWGKSMCTVMERVLYQRTDAATPTSSRTHLASEPVAL